MSTLKAVNHRERMLRAFEFRSPDRIPVYYHRSQGGMYVHGEKLLELYRAYPPDNWEAWDVPVPEPQCLATDGSYHQLETDEWGTTWESCTFGLQGSPRGLPLADLSRLADYRVPPAPRPEGPEFEAERAAIAARREGYLNFGGWILLFEKLCELRPMDDVLVELYTGEKWLFDLLDEITQRAMQVLEYELALGRDVIYFADDWGFQNAPAISPEKFREIFAPRYAPLFERARAAGAKVLFHSCGQLAGILDELLELKIDCIWHQTGCYDAQAFAEKCAAGNCAALIHPDRQHLIPRGTPADIREAVARYCEIYRKLHGGGIFWVEMENDAPFENIEALITAIDDYR